MSLEAYKAKRKFTTTPEPKGSREKKTHQLRFVIQKHKATRLHYDFRLELDGVLKSWAVPKGIPETSADKRLAVHVEDHPIAYLTFSGTIPKGNYGAGMVEIWDTGTFVPVNENEEPISEKQALLNLDKGELKLLLNGRITNGVYVLVYMKEKENWLLLKHSTKEHKRIKPMLASPHEGKPFDGKEWLFELKWDGYRAIAEKKNGSVVLYSRNGIVFTDYPILNKALANWEDDFIVDGEIVVLDNEGIPSFQMLQQYKDDHAYPLIYYVFDLIELNQKDVRSKRLKERKAILKKWIDKKKNSVIRFSDHIEHTGIALFEQVQEMGLEGIMAKKISSSYVPDHRSKEWLKIKNVQTTEAIIVGYTKPAGSRTAFGALVLAEMKDKKLHYVGHVGTGFNEKNLRGIKKQLDDHRSHTSPLTEKIKLNAPVTWLKPEVICSVKYSERTKTGALRHPVFIGMRPDKELEEMNDEEEILKNVEGGKVRLTNTQKLYWPEDKITKGMMLEYYERIAPIILPYLKERPLSLRRMPNGIHTKGFYHKDAGEHAPSFVETEVVASDSSEKQIDYIICNNTATLLYVANLGSIEMNPWNSTRTKPDHPSYIVLDLDPSEKNTFEQVIEVAQVAKAVLDKAGITAYPKTSGATGIHIYIPMQEKYTYEQAKDFAHLLAIMINEQLPNSTTIERMIRKRADRIYIDYLQNAKGQTLASAYSIRPVPQACVSAPLSWTEVKNGLKPEKFTLLTMPKRIEKMGDLFHPVLAKGIDMNKALKRLGST